MMCKLTCVKAVAAWLNGLKLELELELKLELELELELELHASLIILLYVCFAEFQTMQSEASSDQLPATRRVHE